MGPVVQTWIFQGNPDQFDLDAYLGTSPTQLPWLVTRYAQRIAVGDQVFIWRTQGSAQKDAARCGPPRAGPGAGAAARGAEGARDGTGAGNRWPLRTLLAPALPPLGAAVGLPGDLR